jgi:hypothetical protein
MMITVYAAKFAGLQVCGDCVSARLMRIQHTIEFRGSICKERVERERY